MSSVNWQNYRVENFQTPTFNNTVNDEVIQKTYFKEEDPATSVSEESSFESPSRDFILVDTPQAEADALSPEEVAAEYEDNREEILFLTTTYVEDEVTAHIGNVGFIENDMPELELAQEESIIEELEVIEEPEVMAQDNTATYEPVAASNYEMPTQDRSTRTYSEPEFVPMVFTPKQFTSIY